MATTKAPTTLQLARKKDKLTCSWKIKDKDYKDGQQFQYAFDESRKIGTTFRRVQQWSDVKSLKIKETSKAVTVPTGDYYPNTSVYLKGFTFQVRGNRDSYKKKHKAINPGWSEWEMKTFEFSELPKPVMGTPVLANEIRCQFPWEIPNSVTNESVKYYYTDLEWESALTRKGAAPTWDIKTGTKSTIVSGSYKTGTFKTFSGTISIEESGTDHLFTGDYSYTRWVRARARGPEGPSAWVTKSHVYTEPSISKNITATLTKVSNGYRCVVKWTSDTNKAKKIDETQVQYCFTVPTADMGCPDGASWENVRNPIPDTQGQNAMQFVLSNPPGQDEVMFVKINNTYDAKEQPGVPILVTGSIQKLKPPTLTAVTPNVETSMVQVTATNNSEVPGSFLAVYYRAGEETGDGQFVGVMSNQTQSIKVPKWGKNGFALGIKAYASAEYTANDASNTQRGRKVVSEGLSKDKQSISVTLKDTPKEKTTISVAYTYEYSRRDVTRDRASSLNDFYVNFQAGTAKTITDPDGDDDSYQNLRIEYDGSKTFTFSIKNVEGISPVVKDIEYTFLDSSLSIYSISPKNSEFGYMESDFVWNDGDIPLPPANVKVRQAGNAEDGNATLYVEWEWNWKQANQVELSWADHEDAWESTDEPQTYVIENYKPNHWKIANLAVGKWWVKLRFIKVTDDATVYGTYADAVTDTGEKYINLATSPAIPKLLLQPEVITEDGTTTATWAYQSNDGSEQAFAEIWEKLDDGTYRVFDPEIKTQTQQFINISASGQGWKTGETHNLALKVTSEKGEESPEFSEAVSVTIADKPEIAITETSLETRSVEVNPQTHEGNPITFTNPDGVLEFAKLRVDLEPTQEGTGDPSPTNVRPIHGVGSVEVSDVGKNLLDFSPVTVTSSSRIADGIALKAGNYVASFRIKNNTNIQGYYQIRIDSTSIGGVNFAANYEGVLTKAFSLSTDSVINVWVAGASAGYSFDFSEGQIEKGSTATTYEPYQEPISIQQPIETTLQPIASDDEPYLMRSMPYSDATNLTESLVGGTVAWNQLVKEFSSNYWISESGVTATYNNGVVTISSTVSANGIHRESGIIVGHKYLIGATCKCASNLENVKFGGLANSGTQVTTSLSANVEKRVEEIKSATGTSNYYVYASGVYQNLVVKDFMAIDLTALFNPTIADYIYSLEQSQAGAGVAWFRHYFPKDYYPYDHGTLRSVEGVSAHETVGKNLLPVTVANIKAENSGTTWSGNTTTINGITFMIQTDPNDNVIGIKANGTATANTTLFVSSSVDDYITESCTLTGCPSGGSSTSYYLTINYFGYDYGSGRTSAIGAKSSRKARIDIKSGTTASNLVFKPMLRLASETGSIYEPYQKHTYPLDSSLTLRGIPKLVDGKLAFDGDIYPPSGEVQRRYGIVDLGSFNWVKGSRNYDNTGYVFSSDGVSSKARARGSVVCAGLMAYSGANGWSWEAIPVNGVGVFGSSILIVGLDVNTTGEAKAAMSGVYLVYELATPTTETVASFEANQLVSAGGTESYTDDRTVPIPVGHKSTYKTSHVYGGYVDLVSGELVVDRSVVGFSGEETWVLHTYNTYISFKRSLDDMRALNASEDVFKCDKFMYEAYAWAYDTYGIMGGSDKMVYFRPPNSSVTTVDLWKSWLAQNPVTLTYPLANPIRTTLSSRELSALVGRNTLTANGNMSIRLAEGITETECLTRLPLTVSISGGEGNSSTLSILRLGNAPTYRPDDSEKDGFDGEVIATSDSSKGSFIFEKPDIKGYLDEEGMYVLRASTTDSLGQSAVSEDKPFKVLWDHQAVYPSADVTVDYDTLSSQITPSVSEEDIPDGWSIDPDDGFDIYRISSDKPELIYSGAKAGQTIVDPYPAFGNQGGHRIVFVTKYGDYTTADNVQAIYDTDEDDGDILNVFNVTIDFAGERVVLPYDISVSHKWSKDFTETKYLGGSVRGDWNPAVSKTTSINTTVIVEEDPEQIRLMRDLAVYPGLCHVRTPDGSSFTADVEVNEDREEKWVNRLAKFSLSITRVDNDGFDGMTYDEWIS